MEKEYLIMDIVDGQDTQYGKILIVKANPVFTDSLGCRHVYETRSSHTEMFQFPLSKIYIDPLVQLAQRRQIWKPLQSDFIDDRVRDENANRVITVHRHVDLVAKMKLSNATMDYHVKEISFNNSDFSNLEETWVFTDEGIETPHGFIYFNSFMEVSQSGMVGLQFETDGDLYFDDIVDYPFEEIHISALAVMRQPCNAWLWVYLINEGDETISTICGYDDLDGFSKYVAKLKKSYR